MRWLSAVVLVVLVAGCGGSDSGTTEATPTTTTTETSTDAAPDAPPRTFDEFMARLPPFDVPASPEVAAYREATIGGFFERCVPGKGGAEKKSFVTANRNVLDGVPAVAGAKLATEYSIGHRDNNGCLEATGPYTSYTTYMTFRLPAGTRASKVVAFYQRRLREQWTEAGGTTFERTFTRGEAYVAVRASDESLQLTARARGPVAIPPPPPPPPRPYGAQYPIATGYLDTTPEPMSYELEPGETCERISSGDVPSIIIPPTPGIRAEFRNEMLQVGAGSFTQHVLVEWSFEQILGDCPPTRLHLTLVNPKPNMPPFSIPVDVRARSGTEKLPVIDSFREAYILRSAVESLDGSRSRSVAVLIRRR